MKKKIDKAILIGINPSDNYIKYKESLEELENLALACQIITVDKIIQTVPKINPKYYMGSGKVLEVKKLADILDANIVIFDDPLSPSQLRNLEKDLDVQVYDRSFLILQIFSMRAQSKQSYLEVSLAQKLYMLPRLVGMRNSLSRQGGSSFNARGPGEMKLELDRRKLNREISQIKKELEIVKKERLTSLKRRTNNEIPIVALVGYTNAGKSSLMNSFINLYGVNKEMVVEKDLLFTTLDTKAKKIKKDDHAPFILIDTVGFIEKLPNELINAFESTLLDIINADLILHVVDGLNPSTTQINFTRDLLKRLKADHITRLLIITKKDLRTKNPEVLEDYLYISNKTKEGIKELYQAIDSNLYLDSKIYNLTLPFNKGNLFDYLKDNARIINTNYTEEGINLRVLLTPKQKSLIEKYINT
ncbi:MAG: GTPase HflX [Acholeplasmataceae bacterium]